MNTTKINSITSVYETAQMFSYFWTCTASDLIDHSDSVPFNTERKWELCISQWLGEPLILVMDLQWVVCVCLSSFSLEANVIISVGSACSPHSAASASGSALLGICSWSFVTAVVSGCKSQRWLQPIKPLAAFTSGLFWGKEELPLCTGTLEQRKVWHPSSSASISSKCPISCTLQTQRALRDASESPGWVQNQQDTRVLQTSLTPQGTAGLAPQGTNSSGTAAGISKRELSTSSSLVLISDPQEKPGVTQCHSPAGCGVTSLCRHELGLCQHWKIFFFCQIFSSLLLVLIQFHVVFRILTISGYSFVLRTRQGGAYCKHPIHNRRTNNQRGRNFLIQKEKHNLLWARLLWAFWNSSIQYTLLLGLWAQEQYPKTAFGLGTGKNFPISHSTMFTSLILLSVTHRRV